VWPDKALGERIAKDFIAILVDVDQEPETAKQYGVKAMPTLVIADSTEKVLVTQVGAPFSTPAKAREWFDGVTSAISKIDGLEKTYADKLTLGKHRLDNAQSVEDLKKADELLSDVLPALLAAKDRRAIETTLGCVRCNGYLEQESKTPVQLCKAIGVFPDDADTAKLCTALSGCLEDPTAMKDEDRLAAQKELEAIVKSAPKDSEGALYAKAFLKTLARAAKKGESTKSGK
jgi:hypothetical protein